MNKRKRATIKRNSQWNRIFISLLTLGILAIFLVVLFMSFKEENNLLGNKESSDGVNKQYVICIDAGHGGDEDGASSLGHIEKEDTLELSLLVEKQLKKRGYTVFMTRNGDETLSPSERVQLANDAKADVLVSIHRNNFIEDPSIQGVEAWISYTLPSNSKRLAEAILAEIEDTNTMDNRGVKTGSTTNPNEDYTINQKSNMASLILEMGFMSNKKDNRLLKKNKSKYAEAIAEGIIQYLEEN